MDSMRSLNTSLPKTPRRRLASQQNQPPETLLAAFKSAALSVTSLYKNAAAEQANAREAGYQEAIDELLTFLDRQNIGLGDGEGWRIRQWATERSDGNPYKAEHEDEEETVEEEQTRSRSPEVVKKAAEPEQKPVARAPEPVQETDEMADTPTTESKQEPQSSPEVHMVSVPSRPTFDFVSQHSYPSVTHLDSMDSSPNLDPVTSSSPDTGRHPRFELVPRVGRGRLNRPSVSRSSQSASSSLGHGAGSKRKSNFGDFFDIGSLNFEPKDNSGRGAKRGRHT